MTTQYCELHQGHADDVEPARLPGGEIMMVCQRCLNTFKRRRKVQWGSEPFKYFWLLMPAAIAPRHRPVLKGVQRFELVLTYAQVCVIRAAGFKLYKMEVCDGEHTG